VTGIRAKKPSGPLRTCVVVSTSPAAIPIWSRRSQGGADCGPPYDPPSGGSGGGVVM
jgi:hypothetical protein